MRTWDAEVLSDIPSMELSLNPLWGAPKKWQMMSIQWKNYHAHLQRAGRKMEEERRETHLGTADKLDCIGTDT